MSHLYSLQKLREHLRRDSTAELRILTEDSSAKPDGNRFSKTIFASNEATLSALANPGYQ